MSTLKDFLNVFYYRSLLLLILNLVGDILQIIVFSSNSLKKLSVSFYLKSMAIVDIFASLVYIKSFFDNVIKFYIVDHGTFLCKFINYYMYIFPSIRVWLQVAASFDRMRTIIFPSKFLFTTKLKFKLVILAVIIIYSMVFYLEIPIIVRLYGWYEDTITGDFQEADPSTPMNLTNTTILVYWCYTDLWDMVIFMDMGNSKVAPFIFMTLSSVATVVYVIKKRKSTQGSLNDFSASRRTRLRDVRFAITIITLDVLYIILNTPLFVYNVVFFFESGQTDFIRFLRVFFQLLEGLYISFYIQFAVNNLVRKETIQIFKRVFRIS